MKWILVNHANITNFEIIIDPDSWANILILHDDLALFLYKKETSTGEAYRTKSNDEPSKHNWFPPSIW
jgi:hypothetical protein